jgi:hypothetical protein
MQKDIKRVRGGCIETQSRKEDTFLVGGTWSGGRRCGTNDTWEGMRSIDIAGEKVEDDVSV